MSTFINLSIKLPECISNIGLDFEGKELSLKDIIGLHSYQVVYKQFGQPLRYDYENLKGWFILTDCLGLCQDVTIFGIDATSGTKFEAVFMRKQLDGGKFIFEPSPDNTQMQNKLQCFLPDPNTL